MKRLATSLICFITFTTSTLSANETSFLKKDFEPTLSWLEEKPKSYARDFFIIQYLKQNDITKEQAKKAYDLAKRKSNRVNKAYKKYNDEIPIEDLKCYRATSKELFLEDDRCLALGLTLKEATKLPISYVKEAVKRVSKYPTLMNDLEIIASNQPFLEIIKTYPHRFYRIFFDVGEEYRVKELNHPMPKDFIAKLSLEKDFNKFIRYVVPNPKYNFIQRSLFDVLDNQNLTHQTVFFLSMNAIRHKKEEVALKYLEYASKKAYFKMDKDKVLFWQYLITKKESLLEELSNSWDINIYSLYAKEILNKKIDNIFYELKTKEKETSFDIYNQFEWIKVLDDIKEGLDEEKLLKYQNEIFTTKQTQAHLAYLLEKYNKYKIQYFITPYEEEVKKYSLENQVLIYAIGRQESRFIPSSISFATAQGIMQIMPFLSKALAKQLNVSYNIYEQFIPSVNIKFANKHLNTLKKQFNYNPLFIAYAYNGGPGYTRGQFKRGLFKNLNKKFEPFLSMELISYNETRKYGKKVLANYYIYNNYLNKKNKKSLSSIFQTLTAP